MKTSFCQNISKFKSFKFKMSLNGYSNGHLTVENGVLNGHLNCHDNGVSNGHLNGHENGNQVKEDFNLNEKRFETRSIHAGQNPNQWSSRAVVPPISMSTTFAQFAPGQHAGFEYTRSGNPTRKCLEEAIASLEGAKYALCFSSGLSAQVNLTHLLDAGDNIVCFDDLYGGTNRYFRTCASRFGLDITYVDARDPERLRQALKPNTKMVWMETPTNPTMKLLDIKAIADIIKTDAPQAFLVIDNTFMSSYFQKPLQLGADVVMHSLTKYMNGHADVLMGAVATSNEDIHERLKYLQNSLGAVPSPFDCFLVNRSIKTLAVRMKQHMKNGLEVAKFLESHPMIKQVIHPGLPSHPQHELAKRQCLGFSGMVSCYINGDGLITQEFLKQLKIFTLGESLGSVESLIEVPSIMTHASLPEKIRKQLGIEDNLVRLSVGLESADDIIADLDQALRKAMKFKDK